MRIRLHVGSNKVKDISNYAYIYVCQFQRFDLQHHAEHDCKATARRAAARARKRGSKKFGATNEQASLGSNEFEMTFFL